MGRFVNEPVHPTTANVTTKWVKTTTQGDTKKSGYIAFVATRDIDAKDEIYFKYGIGYVRIY